MLKYEEKSIANKIKARIPKESFFPKTILIDTISFCNLKCSMCPHKDMKRKPGIMSWNIYKKIIDEIAEKQPDTQIWITFFGEGMILKDLPERIEYAKMKGLTNILFNTNGNLMNPEYSKRLIKSGLNGLYVGIDAFNEESYEQIRVKGNLKKVTNGVLEYKSLLDEYGKENQKVVVQFVEMEKNKSEIDAFIQFWNSHNIQCKVRPMVSWAGKVDVVNLKEDMERLPCYWAMNTLNIIDTGRVALCSVDLECQEQMGDITLNTIEEIWNTSLKDFRKKHREKQWDFLPDMCKNCEDWQSGYAVYK